MTEKKIIMKFDEIRKGIIEERQGKRLDVKKDLIYQNCV